MIDVISNLLATTIRLGTPILLASLGEIFCERSGILNLGLEGIMITGAFSSFVATFITGNIVLGIIASMLSGILVALLIAFLVVGRHLDQVIVGILINLLLLALTALLFRAIFKPESGLPHVQTLGKIIIPIFSQIPVLGPALFMHDVIVYIALLLSLVFTFILFKTKYGLYIRSVGENPLAADTAGVNVDSIRYCCLVVGGATGGLAGAYLSIVNLGIFMDNMTALRGFIAIVIVIFANWRPYGAVVGSLLFGFSDALQSRLQLIFPNIPWQFFVMLPYIVTICMLVISVKRGKAEIPNALLKPYKKE